MKRISLFVLTGILSATGSYLFWRYLNGPGLIQQLTYPNVLLAFLLLLTAIYRFHRKEASLKQFLPRDTMAWAAVVAVTGLLLLYEPFAFKILYDEILLAVAAELIHFTRLVGVPSMANDYDGSYQFIDIVLDKRPFFFPFLVSLVHDFTGYRYSNVFFLNGFLTFLLLVLVHYLGMLMGGRKGGLIAVVLAGTLPLLAVMANSGNQEILNLVMLCLISVFAYHYLKRPNDRRLVPLVYCLILFFQIRYENGIFLIPFGLLILIGWKKAGRPVLPWPVLISPLFLILPALHSLIILRDSGNYFQAGPNGREDTFSLGYFHENIGHAGRYLFSVGQKMPNSLVLTLLGLSAGLLFLLYLLQLSRRKRETPIRATLLLYLMFGIILHLGLIFCFNYGVFDSYLTARLSMPLQLFLILAVPFAVKRFGSRFYLPTAAVALISLYFIFLNLSPESVSTTGLQFMVGLIGFLVLGIWCWWKAVNPANGILILCLLYLLTIGMPTGHAHRYTQISKSNDAVMAELAFLENHTEERILWVSSAPYGALLSRVNCLPVSTLQNNPDRFGRYLEDGSFDSIYIIRLYERKKGKDFILVRPFDALDESIYRYEPVQTLKLGMDRRVQIDRLISVAPVDKPDSSSNNE